MSGLLLRLAGPMQSWGEHSVFAERDTVRFPTRSGLIGLLAAAEGLKRGACLKRYQPLGFTVRIDRPGIRMRDFHTIGGGYPRHLTPATAEGKRRPSDGATIVTTRHYLADAVFCVAVTGPDQTVQELAQALTAPQWQPYLGRRSCPPDAPLLLRHQVVDPVSELYEQVPLARRPPFDEDAPVLVEFVTEATGDGSASVTELQDVPVSFDPRRRRYLTRTVTITEHQLSRTLCHRPGRDYQEALHAYVRGIPATQEAR